GFQQALRVAPGSPAAEEGMGIVYSREGDYDRALALLLPLASRFPQDTTVQFNSGLSLYRVGRYTDAASAFEQALAADPDDAAAHFELKLCYQQTQQISKARREDAIHSYLGEDSLHAGLSANYLRRHPGATPAPFPVLQLTPP
ncbi:MAG TPA: tetratricopeptide repeat protein, partial [Chthonomonadales bacterium]|nr:tetratricopeptide repeat protein [Chthonomonadales bacterium]